jgi:hypothetical protein
MIPSESMEDASAIPDEPSHCKYEDQCGHLLDIKALSDELISVCRMALPIALTGSVQVWKICRTPILYFSESCHEDLMKMLPSSMVGL